MSIHSCVVHDFPLPDREYYAAASDQWDEPTVSKPRRPAPSRIRRGKRRSPLPLLALTGLMLFAAGFLLGRAEAAGTRAAQAAAGAGSGGPVRILAVPGAVRSTGEGEAAAPEEDWALLLVNESHPLPEGFQVPEFTQLVNGHSIDKRAYPALQRMMDACRADGLSPTICSSYRTWEKQEELFENKVQSCLSQAGSREEAEEQAAVWVARPGTSEHQAGLAVDIVDKSYQSLDSGQEETAVQRWLMEHCAEFGFILRYPNDKSGITGIGYEPWHYRYVGEEAAREIMSRGLCLEEYLGVD
ncbi:M15 family metallopeptidase [uncultured Oscillibacter sp.]|uniref:M15 family metallopeptidase n=1 Tax=uncultured Oscillibacter sp. TaxID=876091 RepID=UPI00262188B1|nr:M15 family metallopeptidase [uncultured Oscillibacter sp.]